MAKATTVVLAGGTGLIGRELSRLLLAQSPAPNLHLLVRRRPADADTAAHWHVVDFRALPALPAGQFAFCCLGTTIKQAGSQAAFRAVDFEAVQAFAIAARAAGIKHLAVTSALGASPSSTSFYNRVKGEMEAAVARVGFDSVVIARPSLLSGDRAALGQPQRSGERLALWLTAPIARWIPQSLRPIPAHTVAQGMWRALQQQRPGVRVVESAELHELGR